METVARVIRNTPVAGLQRYFNERFEDGSSLVDWNGSETIVTTRLLKAISCGKDKLFSPVAVDFDRVFEMTDESGQQAIISVMHDRSDWQTLENAYDRALWLFLQDQAKFRQAEEVRFAEHNRRGRRWSGFSGPVNLFASHEGEHRQEFEKGICNMFKTDHARLDLYDRVRFDHQGDEQPLVQGVVYREGLPNGLLEFNNGELSLRSYRPVLEAVITYEPATGVIEVMGQDSKSRPRVARLFAQAILRKQILGIFLPLRRYDLSSLMSPRRFSTDPEDGISHVQVSNLGICHRDIPHASFSLNLKHGCELTPYEFSDKGFEGHGPLGKPEFEIFQATLSVHFRPDSNNRRGKVVHVKITLPNGCDLKGKTEKERLICEKYLPLWGLVQEADGNE
ncbi:MAG: hypothetical protein HQL73_10000 [Magnetococcales bacterium]|nr:hypothetical protein [Magnetococcales bacterium]